MDPLDLEELAARADLFDRAVLASPGIDRFCSSSSWVLPAARALMAPGRPWIFFGPAGYLATVIRRGDGGRRMVQALELAWGLACPLVGPVPAPLAAAAAEVLAERERDWDLVLLSGLPVGSTLLDAALAQLSARYAVGLGPVTRRHVASLAGGLDGFLARRPRTLRKGLRQARRRAADAGVVFTPQAALGAAAAAGLYDRILAIERRSWKGRSGAGFDREPMRSFYQRMVLRLAERGQLRCFIAETEGGVPNGGRDLAFVLGAVFGDTYRGLQFSFDDEERRLGLGNLAQVHQIASLAEREPAVTRYDLGTGGDYKRAWAEQVQDSVVLVARR